MRSNHHPSQYHRDPPSRDPPSQYSDAVFERVIQRVLREQQNAVEEPSLRQKREPLPFGASATNPQGEPRQPKHHTPTQPPVFPEQSFQPIHKPRPILVEMHEPPELPSFPARIAKPNQRSADDREYAPRQSSQLSSCGGGSIYYPGNSAV
ncbi:hypothetical protein N0V90_003856 [Kalmusia sp. IMI 367209]|nr:hypothetical protein N0V90_003856 [Kalmusia sp. IMI 367209]